MWKIARCRYLGDFLKYLPIQFIETRWKFRENCQHIFQAIKSEKNYLKTNRKIYEKFEEFQYNGFCLHGTFHDPFLR